MPLGLNIFKQPLLLGFHAFKSLMANIHSL